MKKAIGMAVQSCLGIIIGYVLMEFLLCPYNLEFLAMKLMRSSFIVFCGLVAAGSTLYACFQEHHSAAAWIA